MSSWFKQAFTNLLPFVVSAASNPNVQAAGEELFKGIASKIQQNLRNPDKLAEIASTIHDKAPELTGAIVANSPAASQVSADVMPPGSVPGTAGAKPQG